MDQTNEAQPKTTAEAAKKTTAQPKATYQVNLRPGLEYVYRDFFSLSLGKGDILLELGNQSRTNSEQIEVANRIVISISCAVNLQQALKAALQESQEQWLKNLK